MPKRSSLGPFKSGQIRPDFEWLENRTILQPDKKLIRNPTTVRFSDGDCKPQKGVRGSTFCAKRRGLLNEHEDASTFLV
jgi:hypothetical protein